MRSVIPGTTSVFFRSILLLFIYGYYGLAYKIIAGGEHRYENTKVQAHTRQLRKCKLKKKKEKCGI